MTIREAVLKSMEELKDPCTPNDILKQIIKKKYYNVTNVGDITETPGRLIRSGDTRVKQIKKGGSFYYYLTKNEQSIDFDDFEKNGKKTNQSQKNEQTANKSAIDIGDGKRLNKLQQSPPKSKNEQKKVPVIEISSTEKNKSSESYQKAKGETITDVGGFENKQNEPSRNQPNKEKSFSERDLHKLLSTYLKREESDICTKTIFHEQSSNKKEGNQIWMHPDMVGIRFLKLENPANQNFLKSINRMDTFELYSYELKKTINGDSELKEAFFQAVSNSSWANYGYLVALEISSKKEFREEMERLNQSFGIGIIELKSDPFQSKILFPAKYRELDFKTMDKLCKNPNFEDFIEKIEKLMTAEERYYKSTEKEFHEFCDGYFTDSQDSDIRKYCIEKNIPVENEE